MSEYVWCTADVHLADGVFMARLLPGQVWWADDPLVLAHRDLFSATPLHVNGSTGRPQPGMTPVVSVPGIALVKALVAAATDPEPEPGQAGDEAPVRRGPGRPRRDQSRG